VDVCTIIAKNYLAHARVLAASFAEHHPEGRFHVLIIDDLEGYIVPEDEPFTVVRPAELGIDGFEQMAVLYNVLELSTSVKPWLMRWLLARSPDRIAVYLDPDMRLYAPLDEMFAAVSRHGLVLSPHSTDPMPRDGKRPNEQDILTAGAYNLGFIGIGSGDFADQLLEWWAERLKTDCIVDPRRGFFVDQRWIDLVPGMAESFHLLRDRGFNVAYWNLSSRPISRDADGAWIAGDVPLRLFHFSGFDQTRPDILSKHQNRIALAEHPDLAELCRAYAVELLAAGAEEVRDWPYTYASTASGIPLNAVVRNVYRRLAAAGENGGSVFEEAGERVFVGHLNAPAPAASGGEVGITNYLAALHDEREDLRRAYPDIGGADAAGYLGWARVFGRVEVPDELLPAEGSVELAVASAAGDADATSERRARLLGVNVAGYLNSELGVGEVARQAIRALDNAGIPVLPVGIAAPQSRQGHAFTHRGTSQRGYPINLICVNADMLPSFAAGIGEPFFAGRHSIGWWWWEASEFPERWLGSFAHVDELWAGSRFVAEALEVVSPVPVIQMPLPVSVAGAPRADPARFGLPAAAFSFLFSFDYSSVLERKNPLGAIDAFLRAFPQAGEAIFVLKSINAGFHPVDHERVRELAAGHRHVHLIDGYLEPADKDRLLASCDGYVSLHRSEGFGITMAEAMFLGKPVVATGYSGNVDFMTAENSYLVDYALAPIGPGAEPYPPGGVWADPDLDHAAALMREVYEDREEARRRAARGYADIRRTHSVAVAGAKMSQRLNTIVKREVFAVGGWEAPAALERAERANLTLKEGPPLGAPSRAGPVGRGLRRAALRLMRPFTVHQASIDRDLLDALRAIGRDVDELGARGVAVETLALRGLRDLEQHLRGLLEPEIAAGGAGIEGLSRQLEAVGREIAGINRLAQAVAAGAARTDDLAGQVDELRVGLRRHAQLLSVSDLPIEADLSGYPAAPVEPWSEEYNAAHAAFVGRALDDSELIELFRCGGPFPAGYGQGFDERVVEFPWLAGRSLSGRVLDAGSTLNHLHVLRRLRPRMDDLHIVTLAAEDRSFPRLGVSYLYADLRALPLADNVYDRVVSVSTLEHVGLDLQHFGADGTRSEDPQEAALVAADELRRVVRPGGEVLITVPVGVPERFDWVRALSLDELDQLIDRFAPVEVDLTFFRHDGGWRRVGRDSVADARYRDHLSGTPPRARVVAAEAVACVALKPA
jgi:glycosyltransferase involved in cell wall biosynthesis/SAM-dependent methyltransferase